MATTTPWSDVVKNTQTVKSDTTKSLFKRAKSPANVTASDVTVQDLFAQKAVANLTPCTEYPLQLQSYMTAAYQRWMQMFHESLVGIGKDTWERYIKYYDQSWESTLDSLFESSSTSSDSLMLSPDVLVRQTSVTWSNWKDFVASKHSTLKSQAEAFYNMITGIRNSYQHIRLHEDHVPLQESNETDVLHACLQRIPGYIKLNESGKTSSRTQCKLESVAEYLQDNATKIKYTMLYENNRLMFKHCIFYNDVLIDVNMVSCNVQPQSEENVGQITKNTGEKTYFAEACFAMFKQIIPNYLG